MKVGELDVLPVWDGLMVTVEPAGFPPHDSPEFEPHSEYITAEGDYHAELGGFLVRSAEKVVLIDAGLGSNGNDGVHQIKAIDGGPERYLEMLAGFGLSDAELARRRKSLDRHKVTNGSLPDSLRKYGVQPADITDVVITHMHPDHLGWVSVEGRPFFPQAKIWCHDADLDLFLGDSAPDESGTEMMFGTPPTKDRMAPVHDQIEPWTSDLTIAPGITLRHLPGHTPGNAIAVVASGTERAYVLGDTFHCALELVDEQFHMPGDLNPAQAKLSKDAIIREIEDGSIPVASPHFPDLRFGRLLVDADGKRTWRWH
jgi:glyoxylase-like metal-dependent hydrolase (beta-lactamase superfamily II)